MNDIKKNNAPRITLVGAGPGDPELITLKGLKALQGADVVLYDALVGEELLQFIPPNATKVYVGKRSGDHSYSQEVVNRLMVDYALNFGHVVRLKGGDSFVFGRGYEELEFAAAYRIPVTVIPGISSSIGVPGLQHIPVTHRGLSESFWVITGTTSSGEVSHDVYQAAQTKATVVVLMGLKKLKEIVEIFKAAGKDKLPVAIIQKGSTQDEKLVVGNVHNIVDKAQQETITAPAILVFGEVVSLHPSYKSIVKEYASVIGE
ncbi:MULTISPECIES: uroporphyrinogen-III C-methyltransferase [Olivibacter]|uniref:uroporphyrinogen-III C-methyltransferase n=3 Tax=Sphingobacteriaceae TaxID=84566 RepID=F4C3X3_SPHS2|nr:MULTISPECIES: uroporphyrinogen-III C-methyltransferase [Olivibacter]MCL4638822.1 uroporphyrinogen-III C-methyltransferase [Olivibacter sp. UJ_SKK_5.1]MDM8175046.1 uroporphyrinogen-III C-methyltransferase [Olivibacter sp. 47]MDX3913267.1 uroporphyrinogen-III C-methyltransferase [Pseudosphingobacterium sp.]QEL01828.1 uroporphyrinogen-III C-methyltransferase [Olivibacter sp. LS-1]